MSADFANMERYLLQPAKSVHIKVDHRRRKDNNRFDFTMNNSSIPTVQRATHLGIIRTESYSQNQKVNTEVNLGKARRAAYGLFGSGLQGQKGLNILTLIHLYKTYVSPVLLYGLELLLPSSTHLLKLEAFQRKFVKEVLQLSDSTANAAIYIVTGLLPVEGQIHKKALMLLHNICHQSETSIERQILERQLYVKNTDRASWFCDVQKIMWKYELGSIEELIDESPSKLQWKSKVNRKVNSAWTTTINETITLYKTLHFLYHDSYTPGAVLPILNNDYSARETERIEPKLKLLTGTYNMQSTRKNFNQYDIDITCQLCCEAPETEVHFVLHCPATATVRASILPTIVDTWFSLTSQKLEDLHESVKLQVIVNCWP